MRKTSIQLFIILIGLTLNLFAQTETISPDRFVQMNQEGDKLRIDCAEGYAELTFYSEKIVHFAYYPVYTSDALPSWGILPSTETVGAERINMSRVQRFKSSEVTVDINPLTAQLKFQDAEGNVFLETHALRMQPNVIHGESSHEISASFIAPADEHYFGLGQHQSGWMDHRGKVVPLEQDYEAEEGEVIAIPFMLTNKNYAFVFDNPSRTEVSCGVDGLTTWKSEMGEAISYYVIYGETPTDIYQSYGKLCGVAPLPPKKSLGYIQCKQRYKTQNEVLEVARKYREKDYPIDYMIVDWFHWNELGDLNMNTERWPDAGAMNAELKNMNINCMISCWPRFTSGSTNFDILNKNGWLMKDKEGKTVNGTAWDNRGALIDNTNPQAANWYWNTIRDNYTSKGFDSYWLDESEPDIIPHNYYLSAGLGARIYNIYPYSHAKGMYAGHRRDLEERVFVLTRSAFLGTHQFGTAFWSSDIFPEWDVLERQIACGVNFCASGMPYWSSDIGGWQNFQSDRVPPKVDYLITSDEGPWKMNENYPDYPEMYVRWFQYGAFCPTFRAHGSRSVNEVWSYGEEVEDILVDYLELRYNLMPYIYTQAYMANTENSPWMRGLFIDFMNDDKVMDLKDEFMFGPSILVAPISKPGQTSRPVYLPKGAKWYDFRTNKLISGGTNLKAKAPIETIPLYVKAGTILPKANGLKHALQKSETLDIYIYPGADAEYILYEDEGTTYEYEEGKFATAKFIWDDSAKKLTIEEREGDFNGMIEELTLNIIKVSGSESVYSNDMPSSAKQVKYNGSKTEIAL
ncbi:MAG: DUF5110 domain-containing protein [Cyclobacteriaceae bacterium]